MSPTLYCALLVVFVVNLCSALARCLRNKLLANSLIKVGTAQHLKRYPALEETFETLWEEIADEKVSDSDLQLSDPFPEAPVVQNPPQRYLIVERILAHRYKHGWRFLTKYAGHPVADATWETPDTFVVDKNALNNIFIKYCEDNNLTGVLTQARRRAAVFGAELGKLTAGSDT